MGELSQEWSTGEKGTPLTPQEGLCGGHWSSVGPQGDPNRQTHHSFGERHLGARSSCLQGGVTEPLTPHTCARSDCSAPPSSASAPSPGRSSASLPGTDPRPSTLSSGGLPPVPAPVRAHPQPLALEEQHAAPGWVPLLDADSQHGVVQPGGTSLHAAQRERVQLLLGGENGALGSPPSPTPEWPGKG